MGLAGIVVLPDNLVPTGTFRVVPGIMVKSDVKVIMTAGDGTGVGTAVALAVAFAVMLGVTTVVGIAVGTAVEGSGNSRWDCRRCRCCYRCCCWDVHPANRIPINQDYKNNNNFLHACFLVISVYKDILLYCELRVIPEPICLPEIRKKSQDEMKSRQLISDNG